MLHRDAKTLDHQFDFFFTFLRQNHLHSPTASKKSTARAHIGDRTHSYQNLLVTFEIRSDDSTQNIPKLESCLRVSHTNTALQRVEESLDERDSGRGESVSYKKE